MAGLFDFEHYYTEKQIKTDIKLDVSDIPMKSTASSSAMNEDGTVDEVNMNELVTNNVMYRITGMTIPAGQLDANSRIRIVTRTTNPESDFYTDNSYYLAIGYPLDDLVESGIYAIPESRSVIQDFTLTVGMAVDNVSLQDIRLCTENASGVVETPVAALTLSVTPRFRYMNKGRSTIDLSLTDAVDQNFWHQEGGHLLNTMAFNAVGFMGGLYKSSKWLKKQSEGRTSAVYQYDSFVKMINNLGKTAKENNLGIKTVFYDTSFANPVTRTKGMSNWQYMVALYKADWTRTDISKSAKVKDVYGNEVTKFVDKCRAQQSDPLPDISGDGATALIPTVSDVFKNLYTSKEDLASEFTNKFIDAYKSLTSIAGVRPFMSGSLKRKLDSARYALRKLGEGTPQMMLDLASCRNLLALFDAEGYIHHRFDPSVQYPTNPTKANQNRDYDHGVRMVAQWGGQVNLVTGFNGTLTQGHVAVADAQDYEKASYSSALTYATAADPKCRNWQISSSEMTVADIKNTLCEYFGGMYNKRNDVEEGEEGYTRWWYDSEQNPPYRLEITYKDTSSDTMKTQEVGIVDYQAGIDTSTIQSVTNLIEAAKRGDTLILYTGTSRAFVDVVMREIATLIMAKNSSLSFGSDAFYEWNGTYATLTDSTNILVAEWESASTAGTVENFRDFYPSYMVLDDLGDSTTYTINQCVTLSEDVMGDALDEIDTILSVQGMFFGPAFLLLQKLRLRGANSDYDELMDIINRIRWYQMYTHESVFDNKTYIGDRLPYNSTNTPYVFMPARFLVPVQMYKRVRVRYKRWGRTRHKMVKRSIGVRWCEVTFVDNDVYEAYPPNSEEPKQFYPIGKNATVTTNNSASVFTFDSPIEGDTTDLISVGKVTKFKTGTLLLVNADGIEVDVSIDSAYKFTADYVVEGISGSVFVVGIYVPLENTAKSDERTKVRVEYKMPYIPYDAELRRWAFMQYGAFDQDIYASETREVPAIPEEKTPGWVIFKPTSKRIGDMRASMGIYDAVSILMGILRNTFGSACVELVETMRSVEDQELISSGGGESAFLSWHNYGLAAKILINDPSTGMPIEDGSDDFMKLIDVAEAFTEACYNGAFGKPLNVVWCGRLKIGANNFVWEFLPIGVGHKDAIKFREALLNQEDPVASLGYVDVDAKKLVYKSRPTEKVPYILSSSSSYQNAIVINGHHYVSPRNIRNYVTPHDLVLMNIIEFCNLIKTKMQANGSSLNNRASMYEWKSLNDRAYKQLLLYYGLTGSINAARALVSGEYVETYKDIVDRKYSEDLVEMVKDFLGNLYSDAKVYVEDAADGGAWLSLNDGKLHLKTTDIRPIYDQKSKDNFYGEKIAPLECTERGLYVDGVFKTEAELEAMGYQLERVSDRSFIDGFKDGKVVGDDALLLHSLVATQIKEEFDKLRELFENYGGSIMYDHFADGPNASMADMVENEFGLISGQDLIGFDELRAIFKQKNIEDNAGKFSDGSTKGAGGVGSSGSMSGDIFEKVVSNAELAGVRKASLTKEHINVTVQQGTMTTEQLYRAIMKGTMTQANDMFSK